MEDLLIAPFMRIRDCVQLEELELDLKGMGHLEGWDKWARHEEDSIFFNPKNVCLGIVGGFKAAETDVIVRRLIESYGKGRKILIFHTNNDMPLSTPCKLGGGGYQVFCSPSYSSQIARQYSQALPLRIRESDIQLQDILELCAPPAGTHGEIKIIYKLHHIVSQLSGPFDLQRFIELVDQENWDEDAASFMALRQTLLTTLVSMDQDREVELSQFEKVIIDLTDPILSASRLDVVILQMALRVFLASGTRQETLLVISNAHEILRVESLLSRSLLSLVGTGSRISQLLINPLSFASTFVPFADYLLLGPSYIRSGGPYCQFFAREHPSSVRAPTMPGQIRISSRWNTIEKLESLSTPSVKLEEKSIDINISDLMSPSSQDVFLPPNRTNSMEKEKISNTVNANASKNEPESEEQPFADRIPEETPVIPGIAPVPGPSSQSTAHVLVSYEQGQLNDQVSSNKLQAINREVTANTGGSNNAINPSERSESNTQLMSIMGVINERPQRYYTELYLPFKAFNVEGSLDVSYPPRFRPLADAVFSLNRGYTNIPVPLTQIRAIFQDTEYVRNLGFKTFARMIVLAWQAGLIRATYEGSPSILLVNHNYDTSGATERSSSLIRALANAQDTSNLGSLDDYSDIDDYFDEYKHSGYPTTSKKWTCFFPLIIMIHFLDKGKREIELKPQIKQWLSEKSLYVLGFLSYTQYINEAIKHGVIVRSQGKLGLSAMGNNVVKDILGRSEFSGLTTKLKLVPVSIKRHDASSTSNKALNQALSHSKSRSYPPSLTPHVFPVPGPSISTSSNDRIPPYPVSPVVKNSDGANLFSTVITLVNRDPEKFYEDVSLPPSAFITKQSSYFVYPAQFQPLAKAILSLSNNRTNIPVNYAIVQTALGTKDQVKGLGYKSSGKMIKAAWESNLVRVAYTGSQAIYLVNPPSDHSQPIYEPSELAKSGANVGINKGLGHSRAGSSVGGSGPQVATNQHDDRWVPSTRSRGFFPLVAVIYGIDATQAKPTKVLVKKWIPLSTIHSLGFISEDHYFKKATELGFVRLSNKAFILASKWQDFAQKFFLQLELSRDFTVSGLLNAIFIAEQMDNNIWTL